MRVITIEFLSHVSMLMTTLRNSVANSVFSVVKKKVIRRELARPCFYPLTP